MRNTEPREWDDSGTRLQRLEMQWRPRGCVGPTCWTKSQRPLNHSGTRAIRSTWTPPGKDGAYDIR